MNDDTEGVLDYAARGLDACQDIVGGWAERTFPGHTADTHIIHLHEQLAQLAEALDADQRVGERIADIVILCLSLAHLNGLSLSYALFDKHATNQARVWGSPFDTTITHHRDHVPPLTDFDGQSSDIPTRQIISDVFNDEYAPPKDNADATDPTH